MTPAHHAWREARKPPARPRQRQVLTDGGAGNEHGRGHTVHHGTDAFIAYALAARGGPSDTFADRDGTVPW
jgi:hypothetical protein